MAGYKWEVGSTSEKEKITLKLFQKVSGMLGPCLSQTYLHSDLKHTVDFIQIYFTNRIQTRHGVKPETTAILLAQ